MQMKANIYLESAYNSLWLAKHFTDVGLFEQAEHSIKKVKKYMNLVRKELK